MPVVAIETSTIVGSIAIVDAENVICETSLYVKATHSEKLMAAIDRLFIDSGLTLGDMDAIAVSVGPGSFTGLRIGLSAAKGLSYGAGKPIIGIPTLDALAVNMTFSRHLICPILDARKGEVYTAIYKGNNQILQKTTDDIAVSPGALVNMITEETVFLGDGVRVYREFLMKELKGLYKEAPISLQLPRSANVGLLALKRLVKGDVDAPFTLTPKYVRKSEAEMRWKER